MTDHDLDAYRAQLAAARTRAPAPRLSLKDIADALADHIRFEVACGHHDAAERVAVIRDQVSTLPAYAQARLAP